MPVVVVEMWAGRTEEQKATIIRGITKVFEEIGIKPEHVQVILHEIPKGNWGIGGEQASKRFP
jgi:4-oxalocrotonate tautomerase